MKHEQAVEEIKMKIKKIKYDLSALYLAYRKKDVPVYAKIIIIIAVVYALSPIDLIPDFIPVLGYLDDLIIVPFFIFIAVKLIPKNIMNQCREEADGLWKDGKPKKWYYAAPVIIIWLFVLFVIIKNIFFKV